MREWRRLLCAWYPTPRLSTRCSVPERRPSPGTSVRRRRPITWLREKTKTSARCHWQRAPPPRRANRSNRRDTGRASHRPNSASSRERSVRHTTQISSCAKNSRWESVLQSHESRYIQNSLYLVHIIIINFRLNSLLSIVSILGSSFWYAVMQFVNSKMRSAISS